MNRSRFSWPLAALAACEGSVLLAVFYSNLTATAAGMPSDSLDSVLAYWRVGLISALVVLMMFSLGLYTWHVAQGYVDLLSRVLAAFLVAFVIYATIVYVAGVFWVSPRQVAMAMAVAVPAVVLVRLVFLHVASLAHLKSRILVLGSGEHAARVGALENRGHASRFIVAGFVPLEDVEIAVDRGRLMEMPEDLAAFTAAHGIDETVIAMEDRRGRLPLEALVAARLKGLRITDYQTFCERALGRIDLDALRPSWFLHADGFRSSRWHKVLKRLFDICLSVAVLAFTLPILAVTAAAILIESGRPVFYRQERVGLGGRLFVLMKFRSMRADAEAAGRPEWARKDDERVTRVGAFIRKTRIDEIPQVFNVLKGDMSFVGPRPERPYFVEMLAREIPFYHERHSVKPGITGWAQLNYPYGASVEDARQKLEYDLFYIKYFTIVFDMSVAVQTLRVILWSQGAR